MVVEGLGIVALQCGGKSLNAIVVGGGLFLWCWKGGGEVAQEVQGCMAKSSMGFEDDWGDRMWVVLLVLVELSKMCGVSWVSGTRQSLCIGGGGDHDIQVDSGVGGGECDVGPVEW